MPDYYHFGNSILLYFDHFKGLDHLTVQLDSGYIYSCRGCLGQIYAVIGHTHTGIPGILAVDQMSVNTVDIDLYPLAVFTIIEGDGKSIMERIGISPEACQIGRIR